MNYSETNFDNLLYSENKIKITTIVLNIFIFNYTVVQQYYFYIN